MSDQYLALCQYNPKTTAVKFAFVAADPNEAMVEMRRASGVRNVADLHQFTLMRVVEGGYVVVAERTYDPPKPVTALLPVVVEEKPYKSYTQAAA